MGLRASTLGIAGLVIAACASLPPEREAERRLMLDAAHECRIQHPVIRQVEIDRFDRLVYWFREDVSPTEREAFLTCWRERMRAKRPRRRPSRPVPEPPLPAPE